MNFFSVKVAKGIRISASPRGLRAHVGPRGARVHVGSGRTGVSTGRGPFTYYTSLGTRGRSSASAKGPSQGQIAQAQKAEEAHRLAKLIQEILEVHRLEFANAERPIAPPPDPIDEDEIVKARERDFLKGLPFWKVADRRGAKARAAEAARLEIRNELEFRNQARESRQLELDATWERLCANDPLTVIQVIDEAFEDNKAPAAPVNVEGSTLSLAMLAPGLDEIPEKKPAVTPSGKATVKSMTKAESAEAYLTLICGHLLATIKEALVVAPGIEEVRAVVVRRAESDVYGNQHLEVLLAATFPRANLERVNWREAEAIQIVEQAARELLWELKGRPAQLRPLDLDAELDLKRFIDALSEPNPDSTEVRAPDSGETAWVDLGLSAVDQGDEE